MRVLVLGGTSFMGPFVIRELVRGGAAVTVFHRGKSTAELPSEVEHIFGDRYKLESSLAALRHAAPDVVLDMLAFTEQHADAVIAAFAGIARRWVVASSCDVYRAYDRLRRKISGPPDPVPLREDAPLRERLFPHHDQAVSPAEFSTTYEKILVERAAQKQASFPATIVRLPMVYGPGDMQHRLFPYLKRMDDGRAAILTQESAVAWQGPRGYVEDMGVALALCVLNDAAAGRIYNVADSSALTESEWIRRIGRAAEWKGKVVALPDDKIPRHLKVEVDCTQNWTIDSSRIRSELGYVERIDPDDAMRRTVAWERSHPPASFNPTDFDYAAEDAVGC